MFSLLSVDISHVSHVSLFWMKTPENWSQCSVKCWNIAWGRHMGIHWLLLSLGDWQTKILKPLLRPYVTKHTCYHNNACSASRKYHNGQLLPSGITEPTSPSKKQQTYQLKKTAVLSRPVCCVIPLFESHITSKQQGIIIYNHTSVCLTFSNLLG